MGFLGIFFFLRVWSVSVSSKDLYHSSSPAKFAASKFFTRDSLRQVKEFVNVPGPLFCRENRVVRLWLRGG